MAAKKEADSVAVIKEACMADARRIAGEKEDAEEDLAQARPFLEEAERAVESIKVTMVADKGYEGGRCKGRVFLNFIYKCMCPGRGGGCLTWVWTH